MAAPLKRTIILSCSDGKACTMDEAAASQSEKLMSDATINEFRFKDPKITPEVLDKVIEYCNKHSEYHQQTDDHTTDEQQVEKWDQDFIQGFADDKFVLAVLIAAKWLEIKSLSKLTADRVRNAMKKMSIEEIRELFDVVNDHTPEQMEKIERDMSWTFE